MKKPKPKYKKGDKVNMVINGEDYGVEVIKKVSHFKKEWWYELEGLVNPSEESILNNKAEEPSLNHPKG
jgi:hypothetical protein